MFYVSPEIWTKDLQHSNDGHLDLVNKSSTIVAERYFIGFVDPENIRLGNKYIFLAGLEINIS